MKFAGALAIARAVFLFGPPVLGNKVQLTGRSVFANLTITTSSTVTSGTAAASTSYCPTEEYEWIDCNRPGNPIDIGFAGMDDNPYNTVSYPYNIVPANPSIASVCASSWSSSASAYHATAAISTVTPKYATSTVDVYYDQSFTWVPDEPCCLNCTILGGAITVMVWPTPAPEPPVSVLVDTLANFTFTSPSVYVVFQSIGATDLCGAVGGSYQNTTIAFEPGALSTQRNYFAAATYTAASELGYLQSDYCTHAIPNLAWSTFDYLSDEAGQCTQITTTWWSVYYSNDTTMYTAQSDFNAAVSTADISCGLGCEGTPIDEFICVFNPCSPWVSVPTQVYGLDPRFSTCQDGIKAFFDPPSFLTTASGLVAFTASAASKTSPISSSSIKPGPTPVSVIAVSTTPPNVGQSTKTSSPVSKDPPSTSSSAAGAAGDQNTQSDSSPANSNDPTTQQADPPTSSPVPITAIGSIIVSQDPSSNVIVGSHTLTPGQAVTLGSNTFSLAPSGTAIIIDGSTAVLAPTVNALSTPAGLHITTSSGTPLLIVGSQTILPGSAAIVVSGTTYSVAPSGNVVVVDGTSQYLVGSQTLAAGGSAITVSGIAYSLEPGGESVAVGGSTEAIASFLATGSSGLGGAILTIGGFGTHSGGSEASSTAGSYNGTVFAGGARAMSIMVDKGVMFVGVVWLACLGGVFML